MKRKGEGSSTSCLVGVLERRKAVIDSAIVRILKREKEMSLDSIAAMVRRGVGPKVDTWVGLVPVKLTFFIIFFDFCAQTVNSTFKDLSMGEDLFWQYRYVQWGLE